MCTLITYRRSRRVAMVYRTLLVVSSLVLIVMKIKAMDDVPKTDEYYSGSESSDNNNLGDNNGYNTDGSGNNNVGDDYSYYKDEKLGKCPMDQQLALECQCGSEQCQASESCAKYRRNDPKYAIQSSMYSFGMFDKNCTTNCTNKCKQHGTLCNDGYPIFCTCHDGKTDVDNPWMCGGKLANCTCSDGKVMDRNKPVWFSLYAPNIWLYPARGLCKKNQTCPPLSDGRSSNNNLGGDGRSSNNNLGGDGRSSNNNLGGKCPMDQQLIQDCQCGCERCQAGESCAKFRRNDPKYSGTHYQYNFGMFDRNCTTNCINRCKLRGTLCNDGYPIFCTCRNGQTDVDNPWMCPMSTKDLVSCTCSDRKVIHKIPILPLLHASDVWLQPASKCLMDQQLTQDCRCGCERCEAGESCAKYNALNDIGKFDMNCTTSCTNRCKQRGILCNDGYPIFCTCHDGTTDFNDRDMCQNNDTVLANCTCSDGKVIDKMPEGGLFKAPYVWLEPARGLYEKKGCGQNSQQDRIYAYPYQTICNLNTTTPAPLAATAPPALTPVWTWINTTDPVIYPREDDPEISASGTTTFICKQDSMTLVLIFVSSTITLFLI